MDFRSLLIVGLVLISSAVGLQGCSFIDKGPASYLIIAVEGLSYDQLPCQVKGGGSQVQNGFDLLCGESVRFTHAYTPSLMSQATISSIFTGQYPTEHGVWHNGNNFLSAKEKTLPEVAYKKGLKTAFFSGGGSVWRKSGLAQGIMTFDDLVGVERGKIYRPAEETASRFLAWLERFPSGTPYFATLYFPDIQFPNVPTFNKEGLERPVTIVSQISEVSEVVASIREQLKSMGAWNNTYVVLVGLNGPQIAERNSDLRGTNLFSENTQVGLLVKPASNKKRDLAIQWKIDTNVSLVDVGQTLFDLLGEPHLAKDDLAFKSVSLKSALNGPKVDWDEDRKILIETAWPSWREIGATRFAVRQSQFLYFHDYHPSIYNSLIDRLELRPVSDPALIARFKNWMDERGFDRWQGFSSEVYEKLLIGQRLASPKVKLNEEIKMVALLAKKEPWDQVAANWLAWSAVQLKNWKLLKRVGIETKIEPWSYLASQNLDESYIPQSVVGCFRLFFKSEKSYRRPSPQDCDDSVFLSLMDWTNETGSQAERDEKMETFLREYQKYLLDQEIERGNYLTNLFFDSNFESAFRLSLTDIYLALPEAKVWSEVVRARTRL